MPFDFTKLTDEHLGILNTLVPSDREYVIQEPHTVMPFYRRGDFLMSGDIKGIRVKFRRPDMIIAPDGDDYIFRWHLIPRREVGANVYLHLQVADDPERPLHDHPWDNQSVILAGGYREVYVEAPALIWNERERDCREGRVVQRRAEEAHRLFLLPGCHYTISLFSTGPVIREWGFWFDGTILLPRTWRPHTDVIQELPDGRSIFKGV